MPPPPEIWERMCTGTVCTVHAQNGPSCTMYIQYLQRLRMLLQVLGFGEKKIFCVKYRDP